MGSGGRSAAAIGQDPSLAELAQAALDGLDHIATEMELRWGVDRLRLLVEDELRARFDRQAAKLRAAVASGQASYLHTQAQGMRRAWLALERSAAAAGHAPLAPEVWECVLPGAARWSRSSGARSRRSTSPAHRQVFTLTEVASLIEALGRGVLDVKRVFPDSAVIGIRKQGSAPDGSDDAPF